MNPLAFSLAYVMLAAAANVIIDRKISQVSPIQNTFWMCVGMVALSIPILAFGKRLGVDVTPPKGVQWKYVCVCTVLYFFADILYFLSYKRGVSIATLTTLVGLLPVMACIINYATGGGTPTLRQEIGIMFAMISIVLLMT